MSGPMVNGQWNLRDVPKFGYPALILECIEHENPQEGGGDHSTIPTGIRLSFFLNIGEESGEKGRRGERDRAGKRKFTNLSQFVRYIHIKKCFLRPPCCRARRNGTTVRWPGAFRTGYASRSWIMRPGMRRKVVKHPQWSDMEDSGWHEMSAVLKELQGEANRFFSPFARRIIVTETFRHVTKGSENFADQ